MGFGNGPVIAAGVMAGGAALLAGWGLTQLATVDGGFARVLQGKRTTIQAPAHPGGKHTGGGSAQEPSEGKSDESRVIQRPTSGRGDEDKPSGSGTPAKAEPDTIRPGDTLTAISKATGIPISVLVEVRQILNPDLIHAGASLLIPPVQ
ncbi:LysM peptidoglycan-binding domain-containing protein [Streptomyces sp. NPDC056921]|uniref:LysM peptidoglycan-binding domain-containing protein n=1 Tax=Streptomyces sp. NPDC056921 TaxID=3345966 RepID=UPI0036436832